MLETVRYLHSKDIVHRDLKPENVVFRSDRGGHDIFLIDFGLSKHVMDLSVYNDLCANKWYTAPEVAAHYLCGEDERQTTNLPNYLTQIAYGRRCPIQLTGAVWKAADIWAIGVMAYAMTARQLPFTANTNRGIYQRIVYDDLPIGLGDANSLLYNESDECTASDFANLDSKQRDGFSQLFCDFMQRILEKDPFQRLTVDDALKHPWIRGLTASEVQMNEQIVSMLTFPHFQYLSKLKLLVIRKLMSQWSNAIDAAKSMVANSVHPVYPNTSMNSLHSLQSVHSMSSLHSMHSLQSVNCLSVQPQFHPLSRLKMKKIPSQSTGTEVSVVYDLPPELDKDGLCRLFAHLDKDGDGYWTRQDIERLLFDYGWNAHSVQSEAQNIMDRLDWNGHGNGTVDVEAFRFLRCRMLLFEEPFLKRLFEMDDVGTVDGVEFFDDLDIERRFGNGVHSMEGIRQMMEEWNGSNGVLSWNAICDSMNEMPSKLVVEGFLRDCRSSMNVDLRGLMAVQHDDCPSRPSLSSLLLYTVTATQDEKLREKVPSHIIDRILDILIHFEIDDFNDYDDDEYDDGETDALQRWV